MSAFWQLKYMVRPSAVKEGSDSLNWVLMLDPKFMATFCELGTDCAVVAAGALDFALRNASPNIRKGTSASSTTTPVTDLTVRDREPRLQDLTTHTPARMLNTNRDKSPKPKPIE
jgi:hypothetical protein